MASYHLVLFNAAGMVDTVNVARFASDEAARSAARDLDHEHIVEVTSNGARVARVTPRMPGISGRGPAASSASLSR